MDPTKSFQQQFLNDGSKPFTIFRRFSFASSVTASAELNMDDFVTDHVLYLIGFRASCLLTLATGTAVWNPSVRLHPNDLAAPRIVWQGSSSFAQQQFGFNTGEICPQGGLYYTPKHMRLLVSKGLIASVAASASYLVLLTGFQIPRAQFEKAAQGYINTSFSSMSVA